MSREHQTNYRKIRTRVRIFRDTLRGLRMQGQGGYDRWLESLEKNRLLLPLMLHNPSAGLLDSLLGWLTRKGCTFVHQNQLLAALKDRTELPERPVWLTFDDGWRANLTECLPVLEAHQAPATIFLSTQAVELGFFYPTVGLYAPHLFPVPYRKDEWTYREFRQGIAALQDEPKVDRFRGVMLTPQQVQQHARHSLLSFENHSHSHALFRDITPEDISWEIEESQRRLEAWTGRRGRIFCYPSGETSSPAQAAIEDAFEMAILTGGRPFPYLTGSPYQVTRCSCPDLGNLHSSLVRVFAAAPDSWIQGDWKQV